MSGTAFWSHRGTLERWRRRLQTACNALGMLRNLQPQAGDHGKMWPMRSWTHANP